MYKNSCTQDAGFNASVGQWMAQEAVKRKIGPEGREGGIILDEMAIQVRESIKLVGAAYINILAKGLYAPILPFYRVTPPPLLPDSTAMWS